MSRHPIFSDAQREALQTAYFFLDDRDITRYWTLSEQDLLLSRRLQELEMASLGPSDPNSAYSV